MTDTARTPSRGPSRSARLVAACRMLAAELPEPERLIDDPFARIVVDERAVAAARADTALQNTIRLRTRYIDDAVMSFTTSHVDAEPQILLLGAGFDARAYRLDAPASYFEVDFPATLDLKAELLAGHRPRRPRTEVRVDLAEQEFVGPLVTAGFDLGRPTIVVWEGVSMYLGPDAAERVIVQVGRATAPGGCVVADYAEMSWFKGTELERNTATISEDLGRGGERLQAGVRDMRVTLDANGFDVIDDVAVEESRPRYGLAPLPRHYPARIVTARKREAPHGKT